MRPTDRDKAAMTPEERLRLMRILWAVFLVTIGLYAVVGYVAAPVTDEELREMSLGGPGWLLPTLVILGVVAVLVSIVVRRAYAHKAAAERRPELVQVGMIICVVLCEVAAMFGLAGLFLTGDSYSYVLFVVAAVGMLPHFPSRAQLLAASPRTLG